MSIVYRDGKKLDSRSAALLAAAERRSGVKIRVIQGSFNSSVSQSAGTHDGSGAYDVWPVSGDMDDAQKFLRAARALGSAIWIRYPHQGPWIHHMHGLTIGDKGLSSGARQQVSEYYSGYDGLAGSGRDYHWRPNPIPVWKGASRRRLVIDRSRFVRYLRRIGTSPEPRRYVRVLQRGLVKAGYDIAVDGKAGLQTRGAFRAYRRRTRLGPSRAILRLVRLAGFRSKK